tara:strand:+ start:2462 stop:2638 length:177 start_codon:yes stop_codon:yes gene_type:complete
MVVPALAVLITVKQENTDPADKYENPSLSIESLLQPLVSLLESGWVQSAALAELCAVI